MCALDPPFAELLAVEKQRDVRPLAEAAAIVPNSTRTW
jgi:hypothetical protein